MARTRLERQKGRRGGGGNPFAMLPVEVLQSPACATLPHVAHRVLVALAAQYSGRGNGSLSLTRSIAVTFGLGSTHTLAASEAELEVRGLIVKTRLGTRIPPRPTLYALGWLRIDEPQRDYPHDVNSTLTPPDAWRRWIPAAKGPHWTVKRRSARWRMCTSGGGASAPIKPRISGACAPKNPLSPVAHVHSSHTLGVIGDADPEPEPAAERGVAVEVDLEPALRGGGKNRRAAK